MKSSALRPALLRSPELFDYAATPSVRRADADEIARLGTHTWATSTYMPNFRFAPQAGQWYDRDGQRVDERQVRVAVIRALSAASVAFDGADIALGLDILKATTDPIKALGLDGYRTPAAVEGR